ncbi:MAG: hypothetical protein P8Y05_13370, partial [Deinococcales bacterium]
MAHHRALVDAAGDLGEEAAELPEHPLQLAGVERYTDLVAPLPLDEAYLDVTEAKRGPASATLLARRIKADILRETELTASA